ncbi:carbohydrate-binding module family 18 protein [Piromyces sp. E2]|nr:carbohydrate-binding module family 18 protein [Piromyces sp. E2]|eukprot:OUM68999.1 carbohydrate-binding module family 18 protein [Piromyces sp. E2]
MYHIRYKKIEQKKVDQILRHIEQVDEIINEYKDIIYIARSILIETWGEIHGSKYSNLNDYTKIMKKMHKLIDFSIYLIYLTEKKRFRNLYFKRITLIDINKYAYEFIRYFRDYKEKYKNRVSLIVLNGSESVYNDPDTTYKSFDVSDKHSKKIRLSYLNPKHHQSNRKYYIGKHLGYRYDIRENSLCNSILNIKFENIAIKNFNNDNKINFKNQKYQKSATSNKNYEPTSIAKDLPVSNNKCSKGKVNLVTVENLLMKISKCASGLCCSKYSLCGKTSDHYGVERQPQYGICGNYKVNNYNIVK